MRKDTHAGSWYDNDATALGEEIKNALSKSAENPTANLKYIISPHAGYSYSLGTAAFSYGRIDVSKINTVFILGPSHYLSLRGCGVDAFATLNTPLGSLEVDTEIRDNLKEQDGFMKISKADSEKEHSIEMQLPILKYIIEKGGSGHVKVVPIIVGYVGGDYLDKAGQALLPYFNKENNLFVISSDFCHFGRRFGFTRTGHEGSGLQLWEAIQKLDLEGVDYIVNHDLDGFKKYLEHTENTICGRCPIEVLLKLITLSGIKLDSKMLSYTQSSKCKGLHDSSVSYCAIAGVQQ